MDKLSSGNGYSYLSIDHLVDQAYHGCSLQNHYLGYVFASLWIIGIVSFFFLVSSFTSNFRAKDFVEENVEITQPKSGKLYVDEMNRLNTGHYYSHRWGMNWDNDWPLYGDSYDSLLMNNVKVKVLQSKDSSYHIHRIKLSRGYTSSQARELANKIRFEVTQQDSFCYYCQEVLASANMKNSGINKY